MTKMKMNRSARFAAACTMMAALCAYGEAQQTGATLTFSGRSFLVKDINGTERTYAAGESLCPTSTPAVFYIKPVLSEGEHLWGLTGGDKYGGILLYRQPLADGWIPFAPFASAESNMTVEAKLATGVWYVDAEHGNDDWDGTADYEHRDEANNVGPKQSLQAAHDAVSGGNPLVYAAPGVYSNGVSTVTSGSDTCRRRLYVTKKVGFRSTAGAERTFIVGAPDPDTADGLGANAIAGVHLESSSPHWDHEFLQGFTITGCYSPNSSANYIQYGVACDGGSARVWFHDCIISNNFGYLGIVAFAQFSRCRVIGNTSYRHTAGAYGTSFSCVFAGNRITYSDGTAGASAFAYSHDLYGCTIDQRSPLNVNGRQRFMNLMSGTSNKAYYCLVLGYRGTETDCFVNTLTSSSGDVLVADAAAYDFRLGALSPAVGAVAYAEMRDYARRCASFDVDGLPLAVNDGMATLGAVQNDPPLPCLAIFGTGGETVTGGYSVGTNIVATGGEVTLTASSSRPFAGFEVNGEMVPYAGMSYTFTPSVVAGSVTAVRAVYDTEWYVDCVNGDDANPGTAALPKQTIRAATTNAVAGDVIHVAPGTYGALEGTQTATSKIAARVVVPADVTLESTGGATNTFIVGAAATGDQIDNATYGTGTNAVRCVYAKSGSVVRGFTLTGGRGVGSAEYSDNGLGPAFFSATARTATVEDCIISNNASYRGASVYQAIVKRCHILENIGTRFDNASSPGGSNCRYYNSVIDKNKGHGTIQTAYVLENCTIGANNVINDTTSNPQVLWWYGTTDRAIKNSAVLGGRYYCGGGGKLYCTNCLVMASEIGSVLKREQSYNTIFTNAAAAKVDSKTYSPILGKFAGIDKGDASVASAALGDTDFLGTPRVLNGQIDIGAVEYDWRPKFSEELGRRFTVTYASPSVTTNLTGGLLVPDGAVAGKVTSAGPYAIAFTLTGGSLAVYVGGELAGESSGTGEQSIRFTVANAADEIRFVYTPEAGSTAVLKKFSGARGFSISIR